MSLNLWLPTTGVLRKQTLPQCYLCSVSATLQIQLHGIHALVYLSAGNYLNCQHIIRVSGCVYYCVGAWCAFARPPNSAQREEAVEVISPLQTVSKRLCNHFKDCRCSIWTYRAIQLTQKENGLSRVLRLVICEKKKSRTFCQYKYIALKNNHKQFG